MSELLERLASRSEWVAGPRAAEIGECLVWQGATHAQGGYGCIRFKGKLLHVARAAHIARHGEPPEETPFVLHHCDNPPCWRDEHLRFGTAAENVADRDSRGRCRAGIRNAAKTHCPKGHPYDEANTRYRKERNIRECKQCNRDGQITRRRI